MKYLVHDTKKNEYFPFENMDGVNTYMRENGGFQMDWSERLTRFIIYRKL